MVCYVSFASPSSLLPIREQRLLDLRCARWLTSMFLDSQGICLQVLELRFDQRLSHTAVPVACSRFCHTV